MHGSPGRTVRIAVALGLALATVAVYAGVVHADFLTFDDPVYVVKNEHVLAGLRLDGLLWAFRAGEGGNWHPLTWISHMLDVQLFALWAGGHHATSLALHVAASVLLLFALDRMTGAFWRSAVVAALFALHPLHVESVAWVSERKDVLSTFFLVLVLLAYARYAESPSRGRFLAVLALYVLGLMSKPMLVTLPFVLLLLDSWPLGRLARIGMRRAVLEKIPLFVLAVAASATTFFVQKSTGAVAPTELVSLPIRVSNALASLARYLGKTFWPVELAPYYPHPKAIEVAPALAGLVLLLVVTTLALRERTRRPYLLVGWLWFLGTLVPVIGLVQVGAQAMADRYTYVPLVGVFLMVAWAVPATPRALAWAAAPVLCALALVTRYQVGLWKDTRTLFQRTVTITRENSVAHKCLGDALILAGEYESAILHLREALRISPFLADGHNDLGVALEATGKREEAAAEYRREIELRPRAAETRSNLGYTLVSLGRVDEGIAEYEEALRISPDLADTHAKLGTVLGTQSRFAEAERHFREDLRLRPGSAESHYNLGFALVNQDRMEEGIAEYEESLRLDSGQFAANQKLGIALGSRGKLAEALASLEKAIAARPGDLETRRSIAVTLTLLGRVEEAIDQYRKLLEADENDLDAMNSIAWIRATHSDPVHRNAEEAVALAERAREKSPLENAVLLDTLAAAYAEAGRFEEAIVACEKAIELARKDGEDKNVERFGQQLELYRDRRPFRIR